MVLSHIDDAGDHQRQELLLAQQLFSNVQAIVGGLCVCLFSRQASLFFSSQPCLFSAGLDTWYADVMAKLTTIRNCCLSLARPCEIFRMPG